MFSPLKATMGRAVLSAFRSPARTPALRVGNTPSAADENFLGSGLALSRA